MKLEGAKMPKKVMPVKCTGCNERYRTKVSKKNMHVRTCPGCGLDNGPQREADHAGDVTDLTL